MTHRQEGKEKLGSKKKPGKEKTHRGLTTDTRVEDTRDMGVQHPQEDWRHQSSRKTIIHSRLSDVNLRPYLKKKKGRSIRGKKTRERRETNTGSSRQSTGKNLGGGHRGFLKGDRKSQGVTNTKKNQQEEEKRSWERGGINSYFLNGENNGCLDS